MKTRTQIRIKACAVLIALGLGACGGGGGDSSSSCVSTISTLCSSLNPGGNATGTSTSATTVAAVTLSLADASGASMTSVSPDRAGSLRATVRDSKGNAVPNAAVTFTTTDKTGVFIPSSGTALTDSNGVARITLPAGSQAGAFTVTAATTVGGTAFMGTTNYTVSFPPLTLSELAITPATLSAGGNASISVTLSNGASPYTPPLPVEFTSPCVIAGKAAIASPVQSANGIASASYTDKGCGVADNITASVTVSGATVSKKGTITVLPALAGSIKFLSSNTTNIALKGTGGFGRQEFATVTFKVYDTTGAAVAGKLVDLTFSDSNSSQTVGGLTLNPTAATSDANGNVTTLVSAGTIPTSVRVVASIHGSSPQITTLSNILVVSTGVPDQKHFSLSTETGNCEGRDVDQTCSVVTATLGDHFGNPAPDGTAVNFTTEGGIIGASCVTGSITDPGTTPTGQTTNSKVGPGSGACSVLLKASAPRSTNGRVTVLAYALGEESFKDNNGNNVFDSGDNFTDKSPDTFRDDNEDGTWNQGEPCIGPNNNGACTSVGDGEYNGVLRSPQVPSRQTLYVSNQLVQIFSGSFATVTFNPSTFVCPAGGTADVQVKVVDEIGNIMPAGTTIAFSASQGGGVPTVLPASINVPNVVLGVGEILVVPTYTVTVGCSIFGGSGKLLVTVTTPITKTSSSASVSFN